MALVLAWRSRPGSGFGCPACHAWTAGPGACRDGYCAGCQAVTGMCSAGRQLQPPRGTPPGDVGWSQSCPALGEWPWRTGGETVLLCGRHSADAGAGLVPWLDAERLTVAAR